MNGIGARQAIGGYNDGPCEPRRFSVTENLKMRKDVLTKQLAEVSDALSALEANPELQKLFDIVSKVA